MTFTVILTHENADFDAVGSQLAVFKLTPDSLPVFSRRVNRNVQAFIADYASDFPFITPESWKNDVKHPTVDRVIVVDSQTYTPLKGMKPTLPTHFIDHHPLMKPLETYQSYEGEPLGATVSYLVEKLREAKIALQPLEATLLILGIYDDTGSLSYGTTTSRDMLAAAWLHDQGARLDLVRQYIDRPLNAEQRSLYTMLIDGANVIELEGEVIVIATTKLDHVVEEISVLAHKVRGMYDGDAVFLLVGMHDGTQDYVQMVARSGIERIDVGQISKQFGGGGHSRAAAAQVRESDPEVVKTRLLAMLEAITHA
jgi:tRNA nucleotidyltransferase (CCA-adding enzyme)